MTNRVSCLAHIAIEQEKGKQQFISGIENFDPAKLKHAQTLEKNPLPTKEGKSTLLFFLICWIQHLKKNDKFNASDWNFFAIPGIWNLMANRDEKLTYFNNDIEVNC